MMKIWMTSTLAIALVACGDPMGSANSGGTGTCNSGPGTCTNPTTGNNCRNGAVCERTCATCDYGCYKNCSTDEECTGSCDSSGNPLMCSSCPSGVCNAGFSACDINRSSGGSGGGTGSSGGGTDSGSSGSGSSDGGSNDPSSICIADASYDQYCTKVGQPPNFYYGCKGTPPASCVKNTQPLAGQIACYASQPCYCCP